MNSEGLKLFNFPLQTKNFYVPTLGDLASAFYFNLHQNFEDVRVKIVDCPDLTQPPFNLAAKGLCGKASILDVGGNLNPLPIEKFQKIYELDDVNKVVGEENPFIIGAWLGPWPSAGVAATLVINSFTGAGHKYEGRSKISQILLEKDGIPSFSPLISPFQVFANLFVCRGEVGKVIKIHCKNRTALQNFPAALKNALTYGFPNRRIGMGCVFLIFENNISSGIDFSNVPLCIKEEEKPWFKFYHKTTTSLAVGTIMTRDPESEWILDNYEKPKVAHCLHNVIPKCTEYVAYLSCASILYEVDQSRLNN